MTGGWEAACMGCGWRHLYGFFDGAGEAKRAHNCDDPCTEVRPVGTASWGDIFGR